MFLRPNYFLITDIFPFYKSESLSFSAWIVRNAPVLFSVMFYAAVVHCRSMSSPIIELSLCCRERFIPFWACFVNYIHRLRKYKKEKSAEQDEDVLEHEGEQ